MINLITTTTGWKSFYDTTLTQTSFDKGHLFEILTSQVLKNHYRYASIVKNVWILRDKNIPHEVKKHLNLPNSDEGIDIIAEINNGEFWAIQCKFKTSTQPPTVKELSTFTNLSYNYCKNISNAILFHTGERGVRKKHLLGDKYLEVGLDFWLEIQDVEWDFIVQNGLAKDIIIPLKRSPRRHQNDAIQASIQYYLNDNNTRGKLIMPCGTGKSLAAYWIADALNSKSTIVAVPSLALIKQSLDDWTKEMVLGKKDALPDWLCICSDESTGKVNDDFVSDTYSLGIPTTTSENEIAKFLALKSPFGKIIFTTYQSADKLASVSKSINFKFDLAILDEAHKTVGAKEKSFSVLLKDDHINISKRMFMTATERVVKGAEGDVLSMDDETIYGKRFYQLTFKKAINEKIITDYKIITVIVNDSELQELINKNRFLSDKKIDLEAEAQMLTTAIALKKAIHQFDLRHTVSFHKSISASIEFKDLYSKIDSGVNSPTVFQISSKLNAGQRSELLNDFKYCPNAIITNARCLTEGVDVPAIDCVLFADQKNSIVDIVQASGRALRQYTDKLTGYKKELGYIIIPIVLKEGESFEDLTESNRFKTVARIVSSLSTQDETIAEELKLLEGNEKKGLGGKLEIIGTVNKTLDLDFLTFKDKIITKIWERVAKVNIRNFEKARQFAKGLKLPGIKDWLLLYDENKIPKDIPKYPDSCFEYKNKFISWYDWLGNESSSPDEKFKKGIIEIKKYYELHGNTYIPNDLTLNDGFKLGQFCRMIRFQNKIQPDKIDALNNINGWVWDIEEDKFQKMYTALKIYIEKNNGLPNKGLNNLDVHIGDYKLNLGSWIFTIRGLYKKIKLGQLKDSGTKRLLKDINDPRIKLFEDLQGWKWSLKFEFMPFAEAKKIVAPLKFKKRNDYVMWWKNHGQKYAPKIPSKPDISYWDTGWVGWSDWLGADIKSNWDISKNFFSLEEAKIFMATHTNGKITSQSKFQEWVKNGIEGIISKPVQMPSAPWQTYKNDPLWNGLGHFLGTNRVASRSIVYLSYDKAKTRLKKELLKSRDEYYNWLSVNSKILEREGIVLPKHCNQTYEAVWEGWNVFLSNSNPHGKKNVKWMDFKMAREFVRSLGLSNAKEWQMYCKGELKNLPNPPYNIPVFPHRYYKKDGYTTLMDWLGTREIRIDKKVVSMKVAEQFAKSLNLKKTSDWKLYIAGNLKDLPPLPDGYPQNPGRWYNKDPEWKGMGDFLGITNKINIKYLSFVNAKEIVHQLNLQNQKQWRNYCKSGNKLTTIPSNPDRVFAKDGWISWPDWLGTI